MTARAYVNQIVKKVKCSKQKRDEIRRQLLADIHMEMEQGKSLEAVMLRMGRPIAIAEEFNANLPEQEHKKHKRRVVAKVVAGIAAFLAVAVLAASWFLPVELEFGSSGLYAEATLERQGKEVVRLLDADDYEALRGCSDGEMRKLLTKEAIDSAKKQVGADWGGFQEFGKCYMAELKQRGKIWAVVQMNAAYENIGVTYTLFFNKDMELSGLYMK